MNLLAQQLAHQILRRMPQNIFHARADESESALKIHHCDHVRKTGHQPPHEFLLLMQARFDFDALGDVHQRALHANGAAKTCREWQIPKQGNASACHPCGGNTTSTSCTEP